MTTSTYPRRHGRRCCSWYSPRIVADPRERGHRSHDIARSKCRASLPGWSRAPLPPPTSAVPRRWAGSGVPGGATSPGPHTGSTSRKGRYVHLPGVTPQTERRQGAGDPCVPRRRPGRSGRDLHQATSTSASGTRPRPLGEVVRRGGLCPRWSCPRPSHVPSHRAARGAGAPMPMSRRYGPLQALIWTYARTRGVTVPSFRRAA